MKTIIALLLILIINCDFTFTQEHQFGLKGGTNLTTLNGLINTNPSFLSRFEIGIYNNIEVNNNLHVQSELLISGHGAKIENPNSFYEHDIKINYL